MQWPRTQSMLAATAPSFAEFHVIITVCCPLLLAHSPGCHRQWRLQAHAQVQDPCHTCCPSCHQIHCWMPLVSTAGWNSAMPCSHAQRSWLLTLALRPPCPLAAMLLTKGLAVQVGGVLAELQAEQARLRQLCADQAAAMQDLRRQADQAAQ